MTVSEPVPIRVNPVGQSRPASPFDMVTAYANAPSPIAMGPGPTVVVSAGAEPDAERCAPTACAATAFTPVQAEMLMPPSVTGARRYARTASVWPGVELVSGKFCAFVATYVAIE